MTLKAWNKGAEISQNFFKNTTLNFAYKFQKKPKHVSLRQKTSKMEVGWHEIMSDGLKNENIIWTNADFFEQHWLMKELQKRVFGEKNHQKSIKRFSVGLEIWLLAKKSGKISVYW